MTQTTKAGAAGAATGQEQGGGRIGFPSSPAHSTANGANGQPVRNALGRVVGRLTRDGWLEKRVDPIRHKLRVPSGWATDAAHLQLAGLQGIRLFLPDGTVLTSRLEDWRRHGVPVSRGFGAQVCLPDPFWTVRRPGQPLAEQLALFGV